MKDTEIKELEAKLINANTEEEAYSLLGGYSVSELKCIQKKLDAYTSKTNRVAVIEAIVRCTYTAVSRSRIIRNMETDSK